MSTPVHPENINAPTQAEAQTENRIGLGPVNQVAVPTQDLDKAKSFYNGILGLPLLFETGGMAFFDAGSLRLMAGPPENADKPVSGGAIYFHTEDIRKSTRLLIENGVQVLEGPEIVQKTGDQELWLQFFRDPDGNLLALMGAVSI